MNLWKNMLRGIRESQAKKKIQVIFDSLVTL